MVGNLDGSFIAACPGDTIDVPVWAKCDENVGGMHIPIATDDQYIAEHLDGSFYDQLIYWWIIEFLPTRPDRPFENFTTQTILGVSIHMEGPDMDSLFNSQYNWVKIAEFKMIISSDTSNIGCTTQITKGREQLAGGVHFSNEMGSLDWSTALVAGGIAIVPDGYAYLPGDANMTNGLWPPMVLGGDITYLVSYFRGLPSSQPCLLDGFWASADANGDCLVLGSDIVRLVNFFRGYTTIEYCSDYEPLWLTPDDISGSAPLGWPNCETPPVSGRVTPSGFGK